MDTFGKRYCICFRFLSNVFEFPTLVIIVVGIIISIIIIIEKNIINIFSWIKSFGDGENNTSGISMYIQISSVMKDKKATTKWNITTRCRWGFIIRLYIVIRLCLPLKAWHEMVNIEYNSRDLWVLAYWLV